jgi:hypothetical protein
LNLKVRGVIFRQFGAEILDAELLQIKDLLFNIG